MLPLETGLPRSPVPQRRRTIHTPSPNSRTSTSVLTSLRRRRSGTSRSSLVFSSQTRRVRRTGGERTVSKGSQLHFRSPHPRDPDSSNLRLEGQVSSRLFLPLTLSPTSSLIGGSFEPFPTFPLPSVFTLSSRCPHLPTPFPVLVQEFRLSCTSVVRK